MNQKGFTNKVLIVLVVVVLGITGYLVLKSKTDTVPQPSPAHSSITVLSPNGGEIYAAGSQMTVKWQTKDVDSANGVWIHLDTIDGKHLNNGDLVNSWTDAPNNGEKNVTIPIDIPAGQYKVAVTVGQEIEDISDNYFAITSATPALTQEQARALALQTWGGCTDICESLAVTVQNNNGQYIVTATYEGTHDDSIAAQKRVAPAYYNNNVWVLGNVTVTQRCQPGRGHQDFSSEPCI